MGKNPKGENRNIKDMSGLIFGRLTVLSPNGGDSSGKRWDCKCDCGNIINTRSSSLRRGLTVSCGCYKRDVLVGRAIKHGGYKDRLYTCWRGMIRRSKRRGCEIFHGWVGYIGFRDWALSSGYREHLVLCRKGDVGDYTPENSRWDTPRNNAVEAHAVDCEVMHPDGTYEIINNISEFCRINGLDKSAACLVSNGKYKQHKGYKFRRIDGDKHNTLPNTLSEACGKE